MQTRDCRRYIRHHRHHRRTALDMTTRLHPRHNFATCNYLRHPPHLGHCTPKITIQARESSIYDEQVLCRDHVPVRHAVATCVTNWSRASNVGDSGDRAPLREARRLMLRCKLLPVNGLSDCQAADCIYLRRCYWPAGH